MKCSNCSKPAVVECAVCGGHFCLECAKADITAGRCGNTECTVGSDIAEYLCVFGTAHTLEAFPGLLE
jgi:hypothetical protein